MHFDLQTAYEVSTDWLGQAVLDAIDAEPNPPAPPSAAAGDRAGIVPPLPDRRYAAWSAPDRRALARRLAVSRP